GHRDECIGDGRRVGAVEGQQPLEPRTVLADERVEKPGLIREVVVKRAFRDAGAREDAAQRRTAIAVLQALVRCRREHARGSFLTEWLRGSRHVTTSESSVRY